jgi:RNA polymerase sigma-70 factor (ECF subfamily)
MDQLRKQQKASPPLKHPAAEPPRTATVERVPDPASLDLETTWNEQWERNLMDVAAERVKGQVDPKHYQIFELYAYRGWPVTKVARTLGVSAAAVYMAKHRISSLIRKEMKRLEIEPI